MTFDDFVLQLVDMRRDLDRDVSQLMHEIQEMEEDHRDFTSDEERYYGETWDEMRDKERLLADLTSFLRKY